MSWLMDSPSQQQSRWKMCSLLANAAHLLAVHLGIEVDRVWLLKKAHRTHGSRSDKSPVSCRKRLQFGNSIEVRVGIHSPS